MSCYRTTTRPDPWMEPRQSLDPFRRHQAYGRIQPMQEPNWFERLMGVR